MKVAIVTGAGQGIGLAIAEKFSAEGYKVAGVDLNVTEPVASGQSYVLDVSDTVTQSILVERIVKDLGSPSVLVNCAGICDTEPIDDVTVRGWEKTFAVNVEGMFFLSRLCADQMVKDGIQGSIVNLASVSSFLPKLEQTSYGASKAAIVSITRSLALIYGPQGVRVNAVAPGVIETPLTMSIAAMRGAIRKVDPMSTLEPVINATPLKRMGTPEEVANVVHFLASDSSSFVTGQTLNVCGGFLMR